MLKPRRRLLGLHPATSWRWPLPALAAWGSAWVLLSLLTRWLAWPMPGWLILALGTAWCAAWASRPGVAPTPWRRGIMTLGFALSQLARQPLHPGAAWIWLIPLAVLAVVYPRRAWRDAPVFPTPRGALIDLPGVVALPAGARILDAGAGMGDALVGLHAAYPQAQLHGIEWSPLWRWVCALRCPWAQVMRGDMWAQSWAGWDLVYLFQRPETMPRAVEKARRELGRAAWLVSLEFEARDAQGRVMPAAASLALPRGRTLWVYRPAQWRGGEPVVPDSR